jgi:hypothetical protein
LAASEAGKKVFGFHPRSNIGSGILLSTVLLPRDDYSTI